MIMTEELKKYNQVFINVFNVEESELYELIYKDTPEWNSMAQIALVSTIEEAFNVDLDMDDIYTLTSYDKGKQLLKSKFGINL